MGIARTFEGNPPKDASNKHWLTDEQRSLHPQLRFQTNSRVYDGDSDDVMKVDQHLSPGIEHITNAIRVVFVVNKL
jgi:hypothetical protein